MNVLVIGSGGREHALAWSIRKGPTVSKLYVAPGNPGTLAVADNVALDPMDCQGIAAFCRDSHIDLVVVGPENPLAVGLADFLRNEGVAVFGPGQVGARLESSKSFAKEFMVRHGVSCAASSYFDDPDAALEYVANTPGPWVIKADGLALGKGVVIADALDEACKTIVGLMSNDTHGEAGHRVLIEEFLEGRELTAMALTDGRTLFPLPLARDHKRVFEGDRGPMTGGMGAFSPVSLGSPDAQGRIERTIVQDILEATLKGMREESIDYRGVIYAGLMVTASGPKVLEYNVRFGDPETQCIVPRLTGDLAGALWACATGSLAGFIADGGLGVSSSACVSVVMASGGYPGTYRKGIPIIGLGENGEAERAGDDVIVFHAGTRREGEGFVTSGGRILAVSALGSQVHEARRKAYEKVESILFQGAHFRRDIAEDICQGGR